MSFLRVNQGERTALVFQAHFFLACWNNSPQPFVWTATVDGIMKKIGRARAKLEAIKPGCTQPRGKKGDRDMSTHGNFSQSRPGPTVSFLTLTQRQRPSSILASLARPALATLQKGGGSGRFVCAEMDRMALPEKLSRK
ncbi:MAG: hypothetical protein ABSG78_21115 [Verrucomicrobiota bacterium]|jgi:hypothetical protein